MSGLEWILIGVGLLTVPGLLSYAVHTLGDRIAGCRAPGPQGQERRAEDAVSGPRSGGGRQVLDLKRWDGSGIAGF